MASIDKRPDGSYRARWREYPGGPQQTKSFARKLDAQRFLTTVEHDLLTGRYVDPKAGLRTVRTFSDEWASRRTWRPATSDRIDGALRLYILPTFGDRPLGSIKRAHIERWAAELDLAASTVTTTVRTFAALLNAAVEDGLIPTNPARGARLPKVDVPPIVPLTVEQVRALAAATPEHLRAGLVLAAGTGLRQAEAMGVTVDRLDLLRREVRIDRQLWTPRVGPAVLMAPKSAKGYRTIALSDVVTKAFAAHLAAFSTGQDGLVFHDEGRPIDRNMLSAAMRASTKAASLAGVTWHDLRHHHASVLLSAGVSPALVAERLGHDLQTLLRTYAHVIRSDEDRVRAIVDDALGGSAEDWLRTDALATPAAG